jgi:hypothetical protein
MVNLHSHQSRRQFIKRTLATTGVLAASPDSWGRSAQRRHVESGAIATLRSRLKGRLVLPTNADYEVARRVYFWNPDTERRPALVVQCAHLDDVRRAVEFARTHEFEVGVRGGGHSPMGWGISDDLTIDLAGINGVAVDPTSRTVQIGAGASSAEVMLAAGRHGLAPVLGQCPAVGAAGVTLGGGLGWLSGLHGASCDNLLSARLLTADGQVLSVDAERNPELLWALRGAGANYGVVTSFECRLHPVGRVTAGDIYYPVREARPVLRCFRELMAEAPDAFQATLNLTPGERGVFVGLCHAGAAGEAERVLRALRTVATPSKDTVRLQDFADLAARSPVGATDVSFRSVATVYRNDLSDDVIDKVLDRLAEAPPATVLGITHYMHGQVCRVESEATAFPLRQPGAFLARINLDGNDSAAAPWLMRWAEDACRLLRPSSGEQIYANYQSYAGSAQAVFGRNLPRLTALKNRYDPANCFRRNSNVEPTKA